MRLAQPSRDAPVTTAYHPCCMSPRNTPLYRFLHPRHWLTWLALGLLWVGARLPYRLQLFLGTGLGHLLRWTLRERRRVAERNLEVCFPELGAKERDRLLAEHFRSLGIAVFEIGLCWYASRRRLSRLVVAVEGLEHLKAALRSGRGILLLSGHFTTLELGGALLDLYQRFHIVYRPHANPLYEEVLWRRRARRFEEVLPRDAIRDLMRALKGGATVWYAPDQAWDRKAGVMSEFFGEPAQTNAATARIATTTAAVVVPFHQVREPGGGYRLIFDPPVEGFHGADPEAGAALMNQVLERQIRRAPAQYLWVHKRFKRRGPELPDLYAES